VHTTPTLGAAHPQLFRFDKALNSRARLPDISQCRLSLCERTSFRGAKGDSKARPVIAHRYLALQGLAGVTGAGVSIRCSTGESSKFAALSHDFASWL
jgi:hypothetical protein